MFFLSTFTDVGNGGALQRPAKDYAATNDKIRREREEQEELSRNIPEQDYNINSDSL